METRRKEGDRLRESSALRAFPKIRFLTLVAIKLSWWYVEKRRMGSYFIFNERADSLPSSISAVQMYNVPVNFLHSFHVTVQRDGCDREVGFWLMISGSSF